MCCHFNGIAAEAVKGWPMAMARDSDASAYISQDVVDIANIGIRVE
jgi:hypothetical protein